MARISCEKPAGSCSSSPDPESPAAAAEEAPLTDTRTSLKSTRCDCHSRTSDAAPLVRFAADLSHSLEAENVGAAGRRSIRGKRSNVLEALANPGGHGALKREGKSRYGPRRLVDHVPRVHDQGGNPQ